jgi:uncharacterized FlaG/YvyC family protein
MDTLKIGSTGSTKSLAISYNRSIGRFVTQVLDSSNSLVSQVPSQDQVAFMERFQKIIGSKFDKTV